MAENGITQLVLNDQKEVGGYDNDGFHPSDKPKKGMTTTTLLNGEHDEPHSTENGHIPVTTTTNNGTAFLNGHDVASNSTVIINGHFVDQDENVNLNCNSTDKCSTDNKLRHYVPAESDGKKLNSDDTRIAIPEDAVINFNTGRIRLSKNAANSPNFNELGAENDCEKEKIPLQDFSTPVEDNNSKAIEASQDLHQNGHGPDDHQYTEGAEVVLTPDSLSKEKLQQSNGTGKFEEYFIPVNTHKKYLRGEKLYLTKDNPKLCQNWRRCIVCGLITIVIAVAILVGVLAATGILLAESDSKSATASISVAGRHSGPPSSNVPQNPLHLTTVDVPAAPTTNQPVVSEVTSQATLKVSSIVPVLRNASQSRTIVPNALVGEFTILDGVFTDDLNDNQSATYQSLARHIETEFSRLFERYGGEFETLKVLNFSPGSIAVRFVAVWRNPRHVIMAKDAYEIVRAYIKNHSNQFLTYEIDAGSLNFIDVVDECAIQNGECSQGCYWSYLTLKKVCVCEENFELSEDGKTCVPKLPPNITVFSTATEELSTESTAKEFSISQNTMTSTNKFHPTSPSVTESLPSVNLTDANDFTTTTNSNFERHSTSTNDLKFPETMFTTVGTENTPVETISIFDEINKTAVHDHHHELHHTTLLTTFKSINQSVISTIQPPSSNIFELVNQSTTVTINSILPTDTTTDAYTDEITKSTNSSYDNEHDNTSATKSFEETQTDAYTMEIIDDHSTNADLTTNENIFSSTEPTLAYEESTSKVSHSENASEHTSQSIVETTTVWPGVDVHTDLSNSTAVHFTSSTDSPTSVTTDDSKVTVVDERQGRNMSVNVTSYTTEVITAEQEISTHANDMDSTSTSSSLETITLAEVTTVNEPQNGMISKNTSNTVQAITIRPGVDIGAEVTDLEPIFSLSSTNTPPVSETENIQPITLVSIRDSSSDSTNADSLLNTQEITMEPSIVASQMTTEPITVTHDTVPSITSSDIKTVPLPMPDGTTKSSSFTKPPFIFIRENTTFSSTAMETESIQTVLNTTIESSNVTVKTETDAPSIALETATELFLTTIESGVNYTQGDGSMETFEFTLEINDNTTSMPAETSTETILIPPETNENTTSAPPEITTKFTLFFNESTSVNLHDTATSENVSLEITPVTIPTLSLSNITVEDLVDTENSSLITSTFHDTITRIEDVISEDVPIPITTTTPSTTETSLSPLTEFPVKDVTLPIIDVEITTMSPTLITSSNQAENIDTENETISVEIPTENSVLVSNTTTNTSIPLVITDFNNTTMFNLTLVSTTTEPSTLELNTTNESAMDTDISINNTDDDTPQDSLQNTTIEEAHTKIESSTDANITSFKEVEYENATAGLLSTETESVTSEIEGPNATTISSLLSIEFGSSSTLVEHDEYNSTLNSTILNATDAEVECREDQFLCESLNTCLNNTFICDRIEDCPNGFDESNCTEGCYLNFKCENSSMCITNDARCDGIWDCDDGSDEENCRPTECAQHEVMCTDGSVCIKPVHICDNLYNCQDRSDEVGCVERTTCESGGRFFCNDGLCIPWALKCDGEYDCKDKEDEGNCTCLEDEFRCNDGKCLKSSMRCDGHRDCLYGEDELGCVRVDTQDMVLTYEPYSNSWAMLCADDWTFDDGQDLCQELGYGHALSTEKNHVSFNGTWMAMRRENLTATSLWTERVAFAGSCSSSLAASVTCQKFDCGNYTGLLHRRRRRQVDSSSSSSHWPFVAYASTFKSTKGCVAKILTPIWLITSAECLLSLGVDAANVSTWYVRTNIANTVDKEVAQNHEIQKIIFHPHSSKFRSRFLRDYDVVMIRLKHSLVFSDKIGAICLPEEQVPSGITCFTGVFGSEKPREPLQVSSLSFNSLAVMLLEREFCNKPQFYNGQVNQRMLCTKSSDNQRVCDNDEGTPLICLSGPNKWYLAGMLVYQRYCGIYSWHPDVFSNLYAIKKDIDQITGQKNYEVPYSSNLYVIVPPTTLGPTDTTTIITTTETMVANFTTLSSESRGVDDHDSYIELNTTEGNETLSYGDTEVPLFNMTDMEEGERSNFTNSLNVSIETTDENILKIPTIWNLTVNNMPTLGPSGILNGTNEFSPLVQPVDDVEMLVDNLTFPSSYTDIPTIADVPETENLRITISPLSNDTSLVNISTTEQSEVTSLDDDLITLALPENFTGTQLPMNHSENETLVPLIIPDIMGRSFIDSSEKNVSNNTSYDFSIPVSTVINISTTYPPPTTANASYKISDMMLSDSARLMDSPSVPISDMNVTIEKGIGVSAAEKDNHGEMMLSLTTENMTAVSEFVTMKPLSYSMNTTDPSKEEVLIKSSRLLESNLSFNDAGISNSTQLEEPTATETIMEYGITLALNPDISQYNSSTENVTSSPLQMHTIQKVNNESTIEVYSETENVNNTVMFENSTVELTTLTIENMDDTMVVENSTIQLEPIMAENMDNTIGIENLTVEFTTITMENMTNSMMVDNSTIILSTEGTTYATTNETPEHANNAEICGKWEFTLNDTEHIIPRNNGLKVWPSLCILEHNAEQKDCLCNVLSSHYVITTLSCLLLRDNLLNPANWIFMNGELDSASATRIPVGEIIGHPEQTVGIQFTENNLALVKLKEPIPFDELSMPVCLPSHTLTSDDNCYSAAGWNKNGTQNEYFALKSTLVPLQDCNDAKNYNGTITDSMTCVKYIAGTSGYINACQMKVGTSLICRGNNQWELHGILTPHILCDSAKPAVYNNISSAEKWIGEVVFKSSVITSNVTTLNP